MQFSLEPMQACRSSLSLVHPHLNAPSRSRMIPEVIRSLWDLVLGLDGRDGKKEEKGGLVQRCDF